jgi:hypothetical protein
MRRIAATLAVVALMFSVGSAWADSNSEANELFVAAVKLVNSTEDIKGYEERASVLEEALGKLNEIVEGYPSTDLAVKLITNQNIGDTSLEDVAKEAGRWAGKARRLKKRLKAAEQGDPEAQFGLAGIY